MPRRADLRKILIVGSGPIVIGQGCEFDYSGVQACKVLRQEGIEVVLVNSNPATIMTDPEFADRTYIEPLTPDILHEIIRRERPDALLPTLGGQTALNLAMALERAGILARYQVELIGAGAAAIERAEDRCKFKETMAGIGLDLPVSGAAHSLAEAREVARTIGTWPLVIRPGFTLGGTGGGIARDPEAFDTIVARGLDASLNSEVLVEECLLGWKEFEMEVMLDARGNAVVVCSIENLDPMGVHTGDSITVAPIQTLSDREYQDMRDDTIAVMRAIGVETGGSNVQWAVCPATGRRVIIEMNPRVSRSSALASKATGFPIAKIAALLAIGYTLDEIRNDITGSTPSCFEPSLDYVVTKIPRFTFEKFPGADPRLGTQMKSVGEAMAIGRTFKESFQKALRSLETGRAGFGADGRDGPYMAASDAALEHELREPGADRIFFLHAALKRGWSVETLHGLTRIDPYFLRHLQELVAFEAVIAAVGSLAALAQDPARFRQAKRLGFSDRQIAWLLGSDEAAVSATRGQIGLLPAFGSVDTCAGEFEAVTPYYYSCYSEYDEPRRDPGGRKTIMVLGGGPNRIGQGIEFDYCCVHASFALRKAGYEVVMVNSNPETVSTDYDTSDKLYFEPLTAEDVMHIYAREHCAGVIVQFGGQTPLNLAQQLKARGANVLGTSPDDIDAAEDRDFFKQLASRIGIRLPASGIARTTDEAAAIAASIGYPVLVRPSFVLGGRGMVIVHHEDDLRRFAAQAFAAAEGRPVLVERFLANAVEVDVDCISDGDTTVVGAMLEHVEPAGCHSGDSASITPPMTLAPACMEEIRRYAAAFARGLHVCGLMNMQIAVQNGAIYMIEVNPRASRTVPFVSKAIGVPLAGLAARCMAGATLKELGFTREVELPYVAVKEAVFPFVKFPGVDIRLTPEMRSTGEVMTIDKNRGLAYIKSQLAAGNALPQSGNIFVSLKDEDKPRAVPLVRRLVDLGFTVYATLGTSTMLCDAGIETRAIFKISRGRPNILDLINGHKVQWVVNTSELGETAMVDEVRMRARAIAAAIPVTTTIEGLTAAIEGLAEKIRFGSFEVCSLQEYHRRLDPNRATPATPP